MAGVHGNMMIPLKPRGGALPEYHTPGASYVPGSGMGGRLSGEGARVAAAAVKVAAQADADRGTAMAGLARAADHAVQVGLKAYGDYESAVAQNAFNQYQQEEMRLRAELNTLEGKNALGAEGVEARLTRWRADARERLGAELGDIGHRMFSRAADKLDAQSDAWAVGKVNKENIAFQNTVSEGSILNARNLALENPGDEGAFANAVGIIKAEYERMGARSGWDEGFRDAKFAEARGKLAFDRAAALIEAGDLETAERAIVGGTASAPGSLSERNLAANNFGNVKNTKGNFVAYATRMDGLIGMGERPLRYANAPEKGWHAESLLDMVKIYAPKGDGANDPAKYAAFLGTKLGIDPKAKTDFRDPKILAGLIKWMPVMEHGAQRVNISDEEAMQAAQALLAGQKPNIVGEAAKKGEGTVQASGAPALLSPAQRAQLQGSLNAARKRQEAEVKQQQAVADAGMAQGLVEETRDFSAADRARYVYDRLEKIEDPARRDKVRNMVAKELEFREQQQKAHDMADAMTLYETGWKNQETPTQFLQRVNASDASEVAKKQALSLFNGKTEENEVNMRALDALRLKIDEAERAGKPMSKEDIYKFAYDSRMTIGQTKDALSYLDDGGNLGKLKQTEVNSIYKALHPEVKDKNIPTWLYDAVRQMLGPGKKPTYDELKKIVARAVMNGSIPGKLWGRNDTTYGEALVEGKQDVFVAENEERRNALMNPKVD